MTSTPLLYLVYLTEGLRKIRLIEQLIRRLNVKAETPKSFRGVPTVMNLAAGFYSLDRGSQDIQNLWDLFTVAINLADENSETDEQLFIKYFDLCMNQKRIKWNLTVGLNWIRPYFYINLDSRNRWAFSNPEEDPNFVTDEVARVIIDMADSPPNGREYLDICYLTKTELIKSGKYESFPELSYEAWVFAERINIINDGEEDANTGDNDEKNNPKKTRYWSFSPVASTKKWDDFVAEGIMALGNGYLGNLTQYNSKEEIRKIVQEKNESNRSLKMMFMLYGSLLMR